MARYVHAARPQMALRACTPWPLMHWSAQDVEGRGFNVRLNKFSSLLGQVLHKDHPPGVNVFKSAGACWEVGSNGHELWIVSDRIY